MLEFWTGAKIDKNFVYPDREILQIPAFAVAEILQERAAEKLVGVLPSERQFTILSGYFSSITLKPLPHFGEDQHKLLGIHHSSGRIMRYPVPKDSKIDDFFWVCLNPQQLNLASSGVEENSPLLLRNAEVSIFTGLGVDKNFEESNIQELANEALENLLASIDEVVENGVVRPNFASK